MYKILQCCVLLSFLVLIKSQLSPQIIAPLSGYFYIATTNDESNFLRIDGSGCTSFSGNGCGVADLQYYDFLQSGLTVIPITSIPYELIYINPVEGGYCLCSAAFPNAYLRCWDGGCNAQYYSDTSCSSCGGYEIWQLSDFDGSTTGAFTSVAFTEYLTELGGYSSFNGNGEGVVTLQQNSNGPDSTQTLLFLPYAGYIEYQNTGLNGDEYYEYYDQSNQYGLSGTCCTRIYLPSGQNPMIACNLILACAGYVVNPQNTWATLKFTRGVYAAPSWTAYVKSIPLYGSENYY